MRFGAQNAVLVPCTECCISRPPGADAVCLHMIMTVSTSLVAMLIRVRITSVAIVVGVATILLKNIMIFIVILIMMILLMNRTGVLDRGVCFPRAAGSQRARGGSQVDGSPPVSRIIDPGCYDQLPHQSYSEH